MTTTSRPPWGQRGRQAIKAESRSHDASESTGLKYYCRLHLRAQDFAPNSESSKVISLDTIDGTINHFFLPGSARSFAMKSLLVLTLLGALKVTAGCTAKSGPTDGGTGDPAYVSGGTGGEGAGPTGTSGSSPGENPGAGMPGDNGTGN
jgi:hypothetical protein